MMAYVHTFVPNSIVDFYVTSTYNAYPSVSEIVMKKLFWYFEIFGTIRKLAEEIINLSLLAVIEKWITLYSQFQILDKFLQAWLQE